MCVLTRANRRACALCITLWRVLLRARVCVLRRLGWVGWFRRRASWRRVHVRVSYAKQIQKNIMPRVRIHVMLGGHDIGPNIDETSCGMCRAFTEAITC